MKVASLFTGCGGLDLGLEQAGHQIILQCESDPGAQQVLRKQFPGVLLSPDICALQSLPKETELLAAGFPCVDVSRAGLRKGLSGQCSGLVKHVFRLLEQARREERPVPWVLLENVEALLDRNKGQEPAIKYITDNLEQLGYRSWAHRVVVSAGFGLPNRRKRVFVLASMHGDARDVLLAQGRQRCLGSCTKSMPDGSEEGSSPCYECYVPPAKSLSGKDLNNTDLEDLSLEDCSLALDLGNARSAPGIDVVPTFTTNNDRMCLVLRTGQLGLLRIEDAERLQGLPEGHTEAAWPVQVPGVQQHRGKSMKDADADVRERARFALIGNAVTVQVAHWLGRRLMQPYLHKYVCAGHDKLMRRSLFSATNMVSLEEWRHLLDTYQSVGGTVVRRTRGSSCSSAEVACNNVTTAAAGGGINMFDKLGDDEAADCEDPDDCTLIAADDENDVWHGSSLSLLMRGDCGERQAEQEGVVEPDDIHMLLPRSGNSWQCQDGDGKGIISAAAATREESSEVRHMQAAAGKDGPDVLVEGYVDDMISDDEEAEGEERLRYGGNTGGMSLSRGWPRAAWFMQGLGRWGVEEVSEVPEKLPFVPLADMITKVGRAPSAESLNVFLMRLREQGWNLEATIRRMRECGANLDPQIQGVVRLVSMAQDADKLGALVWAKDPCRDVGSWWPAEALDPYNLPKGFTITAQQVQLLKTRERQQFLPPWILEGHQQDRPNKPQTQETQGPSSSVAAIGLKQTPSTEEILISTPASAGETTAEIAIGPSAAADCATALTGGSCASPPLPIAAVRRKVLVIFFGDRQATWEWIDGLKDYSKHRKEKTEEMQAFLQTRMAKCGKLFEKAVSAADQAAQVKAQQAGSPCGGAGLMEARLKTPFKAGAGTVLYQSSAMFAQAAYDASLANSMARCNACETCLTSSGRFRRRCLVVRATASAAAGLTGGQLAVLGADAVGARVSVWWPLDEAWYEGTVMDYDRMRVRHTISYDDGDVEIIPLWEPGQRLQVLTARSAWAPEAKRITKEREERARKIAEDQAAKLRTETRLLNAAYEANKTILEKERDKKVAANLAVMAVLNNGQTIAPSSSMFLEALDEVETHLLTSPAANKSNGAVKTPENGNTANDPRRKRHGQKQSDVNGDAVRMMTVAKQQAMKRTRHSDP